jgi:hypothetical protein
MDMEEAFRSYSENLKTATPDGIINIDLNTLHSLGLLGCDMNDAKGKKASQYFHVMESPEKVTLFNDQFVVWIVPQMQENQPSTYTLIALNGDSKPQAQLVYQTQGVYNTPNFVLKILEHYLREIDENNKLVQDLEKKL